MENTASTRPLSSARASKPGLALALALLSVPGSTVAWYLLPAGGLLIGLPLGIAAIVLGRGGAAVACRSPDRNRSDDRVGRSRSDGDRITRAAGTGKR